MCYSEFGTHSSGSDVTVYHIIICLCKLRGLIMMLGTSYSTIIEYSNTIRRIFPLFFSSETSLNSPGLKRSETASYPGVPTRILGEFSNGLVTFCFWTMAFRFAVENAGNVQILPRDRRTTRPDIAMQDLVDKMMFKCTQTYTASNGILMVKLYNKKLFTPFVCH